jgi:hypothetical protein
MRLASSCNTAGAEDCRVVVQLWPGAHRRLVCTVTCSYSHPYLEHYLILHLERIMDNWIKGQLTAKRLQMYLDVPSCLLGSQSVIDI